MSDFVGLDIGSHSVKAVQLSRKSGKMSLYAFRQAYSPDAGILSESEKDQERWVSYLKDFMNDGRFNTRNVVIGIPESSVFTRVISVPRMSQAELRTAIKWEAEQYIPVPLKDVSMDYMVISSASSESKKMEVLIVAAPVKLIKTYLGIIEKVPLNPVGIETEALAVSRAVILPGDDSPTTLVINIGAATTDLAVVSAMSVRFTRSISTGGTALARAVSQALGFDMSQAEQYKVTYGLDSSQLEGKIMEAIKPVIDVVISDVRKSISYYSNRYPSDPVKQAVLCGGTASLPGMLAYLVGVLDIEVQLANPWRRIEISAGGRSAVKKEELPILKDNAPSLAVAVGLAMKEV